MLTVSFHFISFILFSINPSMLYYTCIWLGFEEYSLTFSRVSYFVSLWGDIHSTGDFRYTPSCYPHFRIPAVPFPWPQKMHMPSELWHSLPDTLHHFCSVMSYPARSPMCSVFMQCVPHLTCFQHKQWFSGIKHVPITRVTCIHFNYIINMLAVTFLSVNCKQLGKG
jgi:hypothetical protein